MNEQMQQQGKKPTYRDLWHEQKATLLDIWQGGTKLDANTLSILWEPLPCLERGCCASSERI